MSDPAIAFRADTGAADDAERATSFAGDDTRYVATNAPADTAAYSFQVMTKERLILTFRLMRYAG